MLTSVRKHLSVIVIAMVAGAIGASAPVIAHGVSHAEFAHKAGNAKKLGGKKPSAYMGTTGGLRLVGFGTVSDLGALEMSRGVLESAEKLDTGEYRIHFSRPVRGVGAPGDINPNLVVQLSGGNLTGSDCVWVYSSIEDPGPQNSIETQCHAPAGAAEDTFHTVMVYEPRK